ncbi:minor capsid protein [Streptomyces sp. NPDC085612]|uniref:minor capsid protein n=1 Tax=Streptomyces sp. NPDC085612 TaxID=3365732 RepID=UPI0037D1B8F1
MADLLDGIARYLAERGHGTYGPDVVGATICLEQMPSQPDELVVLTVYDGGAAESDSLLGYDEPRMQIRVRGTTDPRVSRTRALAIYSELHGLGPVTLPDGTHLILCVALQPVFSMGVDENRRHEHAFNARLEHRSITAHRG